MSKTIAVTLCADDYAMSPGVSRGILEALAAGAVTATSVMTTSPWWPESAAALRPHADRADIGLHLNLTLGAPLGPMPRLAPDNLLPSLQALLQLSRRKMLPLEEIAEEIDRQFERFSAVFGCAPDHVDGHQHVHVISAIRPLVFSALEARAWRPWLRESADRLSRLIWRAGRKKALALSVLGKGFGREAANRGFLTNSGFAGFSAFDPSKPIAKAFESYLNAPGSRHLVMCHPGYADAALRALDPVVETREQELKYLTKGFRDLLRARGFVLERMSGRCSEASAEMAIRTPAASRE